MFYSGQKWIVWYYGWVFICRARMQPSPRSGSPRNTFSPHLSHSQIKNNSFDLTHFSLFVFPGARQWNCSIYLWKIFLIAEVLLLKKKKIVFLIIIFPNTCIMYVHVDSYFPKLPYARLPKAGGRTGLSSSSPWAHRFNPGGRAVLQRWENDVCTGYDKMIFTPPLLCLLVRDRVRHISKTTIPPQRGKGKHYSTVRVWHFCHTPVGQWAPTGHPRGPADSCTCTSLQILLTVKSGI